MTPRLVERFALERRFTLTEASRRADDEFDLWVMVAMRQGGVVMTAWLLGLVLAVIAMGVAIALLVRRRPAGFPVTQAVDIALWDADEPSVDLLLDLPEVPAIEPSRLGFSDSTLPATHDHSPVPAERSPSGKVQQRDSTWA